MESKLLELLHLVRLGVEVGVQLKVLLLGLLDLSLEIDDGVFGFL